MILYLSIIILAMVIITISNVTFNIAIFSNSILILIASVVGAVIIEIIIDLILAGIVHSIKDNCFKEINPIFKVSKKECRFYEKIGIKRWKDKILELGVLGGFSKAKLVSNPDVEYINKFLMESYKGIIVHIANIIFGFLIMLIPPYKWSLCIGLPVAIVNAILGILPIFVLRYNIPKLLIVRKRLLRTENREKDADIEITNP